jgi:hypothetical protein
MTYNFTTNATADSCFLIIGYTGNYEQEKQQISKDEKAYNNSPSKRAATRECSKLHLSEVSNGEQKESNSHKKFNV